MQDKDVEILRSEMRSSDTSPTQFMVAKGAASRRTPERSIGEEVGAEQVGLGFATANETGALTVYEDLWRTATAVVI
jgi:hypothetical protein